ARTKCGKVKATLPGIESKVAAALAKSCAAPGVAAADLIAAAGLGFTGETGLCARSNVTSVATLADVTECVLRRHACTAGHLIAAAEPRAAELLTLGGWDPALDLSCIDDVVDGGGAGVAAAKGKALRKCDATIQKATATLVAGRSKVVDTCGAAAFTCLQSK